jgi:hypothetical protein
VTATHNYLLRRMVRGESDAGAADLRLELAAIPRGAGRAVNPDELVVAVFPRDGASRQIAELLVRKLGTL